MAVSNNGIRIISTAADGTQGNGGSGTYNGGGFITGTDSFSISADGTKVAFMSDASNLVPGDTDGTTDIFVKDLTTGAITLASNLTGAVALTLPSTVPTPFARSLFPSISPDGTKVVFTATPFDPEQFGRRFSRILAGRNEDRVLHSDKFDRRRNKQTRWTLPRGSQHWRGYTRVGLGPGHAWQWLKLGTDFLA